MKKFYSVLALLLCVLAANAVNIPSGTKLYLTPNLNWKIDNARFAAYFYGDGEAWSSMVAVSGETDLYEVTTPGTGKNFTNVIFCRMNPSSTANSWDTKWNQTADLTYDGVNNHYTVKAGTWDKGGGTWGLYEGEVVVVMPEKIYVVGYNGSWDPAAPLEIAGEEGIYKAEGVEFTNTTFKLSTTKGDWDAFNATGLNVASNPIAIGEAVALTEGYSSDITIGAVGTYDVTIDYNNMTLALEGKVEYPEVIYAIGNVNGFDWATSEGVAFSHKGDGVYEGTITVDNTGDGYGYFQFATTLGADWDAVNAGIRYGATEENQIVVANTIYNMTNNWAGGTQSWKCEAGECTIEVNIENCTMQITEFTGVEGISVEENASAVYYNLQGIEVANPQNGIFIKKQGNKVSKVAL